MEENNSKKLDVSYGVEKPEDSAQINKTKKPTTKTSKKKNKVTKKVPEKVEAKKEPKKTLIDDINDMKANSQTDSPEFRDKMSKLESVLGVDQISPFGTNELDVFQDKLKNMSYADMRNIASRVGLSPYLDQARIKQSLISEFKSQNKNNMRNIMPEAKTSIQLDPNNPQHAKTIEILGDI